MYVVGLCFDKDKERQEQQKGPQARLREFEELVSAAAAAADAVLLTNKVDLSGQRLSAAAAAAVGFSAVID
jgi:hypothetical protein